MDWKSGAPVHQREPQASAVASGNAKLSSSPSKSTLSSQNVQAALSKSSSNPWWLPLFFVLSLIGLLTSLYCFYKARQLNQLHIAQSLELAELQKSSTEMRLLPSAALNASATDSESFVQFGAGLDRLGPMLQNGSQADESLERVRGAFADLRSSISPTTPAQPLSDVMETDGGSVEEVAEVTEQPATNGEIANFEPLIESTGALRRLLSGLDSPAVQVESAGHLYQLAVSIDKKVGLDESGKVDAENARGPWMVFDQILKRIESMIGTGEISDANAVALINDVRATQVRQAKLFDPALNTVGNSAEDSGTVAQSGSTEESNVESTAVVSNAGSTPVVDSQDVRQRQQLLDDSLDASAAAIAAGAGRSSNWFRLGLLSGLVSSAMLLLMGLGVWRERRNQALAWQSVEQNQQASILRLLDEISALAEGDLNTKATVTEDMTGSIADCVNYAVSELRRLVGAITNSADRVNVAVEETGATAQQLANASVMQSREISRSSTYLKAMADTMGQMSKRSTEAATIASRSAQLATSGQQAVAETVGGVRSIEAQSLETLKHLKRLGDSSQQIERAVRLVNQMAEKTQLLSINVAIQRRAATSGQRSSERSAENSARIADQVQSLAATLNHSSVEMESLVASIQRDIHASIGSMSMTRTEVGKVSERSAHARACLEEIQQVSERLSVVVDHLNQRTGRQSEVVNQLSANMGVINEVTRHSAHGLRLSASALEDLRLMSTELRDSVSDFSLPESDQRLISRRSEDILGQTPARRHPDGRPNLDATKIDPEFTMGVELPGSNSAADETNVEMPRPASPAFNSRVVMDEFDQTQSTPVAIDMDSDRTHALGQQTDQQVSSELDETQVLSSVDEVAGDETQQIPGSSSGERS